MTERPEPKKPIDVGNGLICASLDAGGAWLSLGTYHSQHGFVELTALPPFDERRRGDPAAVRDYRALMVERRFAFLELQATDWQGTAATIAAADRPTIEQRWTLRALRPDPAAPSLRFRGRLDRPALAEITETDPPPPTGATTMLRAICRILHVDSPELPARAEIDVDAAGSVWDLGAEDAQIVLTGCPLDVTIRCSLRDPTSS